MRACTGVYVMRVGVCACEMRANNTSFEKSQENFAEKILKILLTTDMELCIMYCVR